MLASEKAVLESPQQPLPRTAWKSVVGKVQPFLDAVSAKLGDQINEFEPEIASCARHALQSQGKQLRPLLLVLSAKAITDLKPSHVTAAAIVEMVHLATLVHDDIIDEAKLRRGRPTLVSRWGNGISVLLGDCLFAHSLKLAANFPTTAVCRAVSSATEKVCTGEILQTQERGNLGLAIDQYFKILSLKTGELFALSCSLGALLSDADEEQVRSLELFGRHFGIAYQIYDDCMDIFGSVAVSGKTLGSDIAEGKVTLPIISLLDGMEPAERSRVETWLDSWEPAKMGELQKMLRDAGALEHCRATMKTQLDMAFEALRLPRNAPQTADLEQLCDFLDEQIEALDVLT